MKGCYIVTVAFVVLLILILLNSTKILEGAMSEADVKKKNFTKYLNLIVPGQNTNVLKSISQSLKDKPLYSAVRWDSNDARFNQYINTQEFAQHLNQSFKSYGNLLYATNNTYTNNAAKQYYISLVNAASGNAASGNAASGNAASGNATPQAVRCIINNSGSTRLGLYSGLWANYNFDNDPVFIDNSQANQYNTLYISTTQTGSTINLLNVTISNHNNTLFLDYGGLRIYLNDKADNRVGSSNTQRWNLVKSAGIGSLYAIRHVNSNKYIPASGSYTLLYPAVTSSTFGITSA